MVAVLFLSFHAGEAQSISRARSKLFYDPGFLSSLGFDAPGTQQLKPEYKLPGLRNDGNYVDYDIYEQAAVVEPDPDVVTEEEEAMKSWKGYLQEKGPSRLIVKVEEEQKLQPLSDEIWALIAGNGSGRSGLESDRSREYVNADENYEQNPYNPMGDTLAVDQGNDEKMRIDRDTIDEESIIMNDEAQSYRQLMELFSRPVLAMPFLRGEEDGGIIAFRSPKNSTSAFIRDGSRARFEIRRN